ncbi:response regulator transcription factor [Kineococcus rhizosphaerae]|uniref:Two-component system OmpR family response regulator n=1 Tax=Kineococcus rhizosphaerae TaxID=559628 RepID=A0A2T0QXL5_9ACTN|nr:response regulator transcription factor [Kineococcus rhizosphaerae]PRY10777.1 two-component system OmpR family response regulator [Kineococcus rhizosphaerae]
MRVLLVDDEVTLAATLASGLEGVGFGVEVVHDGGTGLERATEGAFDVVVLDIMLPVLNGYEVCRTLRSRQVWTPVLMLTAKDGEYDETDAFDLGADDYLRKPFSFEVLVARLRALVRRGAPERPAVLSAGDLVLDPASQRVHLAGEEVRLTAREFQVLHHFMRNAGDVLTKTNVLQNVWDEFYDGDDNLVEVYVGYLRKKIGREFIETVRGAGYRFTKLP